MFGYEVYQHCYVASMVWSGIEFANKSMAAKQVITIIIIFSRKVLKYLNDFVCLFAAASCLDKRKRNSLRCRT